MHRPMTVRVEKCLYWYDRPLIVAGFGADTVIFATVIEDEENYKMVWLGGHVSERSLARLLAHETDLLSMLMLPGTPDMIVPGLRQGPALVAVGTGFIQTWLHFAPLRDSFGEIMEPPSCWLPEASSTLSPNITLQRSLG